MSIVYFQDETILDCFEYLHFVFASFMGYYASYNIISLSSHE